MSGQFTSHKTVRVHVEVQVQVQAAYSVFRYNQRASDRNQDSIPERKVLIKSADVPIMDNRRDQPRFEINQPVTVTKLEQPGIPLSGRLANFSTKGIRLILNEKLHPGTMVKVKWEGTTLLGEIMYCLQEVSEFAVGLELEDALYEKEEFASMFEAWAKR